MSQLGHEQPVRSGSVITTPRRCAGRGGHQNRHCETRAAVWSRFRQLRSSQQEALPMPASGHNRPTCSSLVCLLPPGADMVRKRAPEEPSGWTPAPASANRASMRFRAPPWPTAGRGPGLVHDVPTSALPGRPQRRLTTALRRGASLNARREWDRAPGHGKFWWVTSGWAAMLWPPSALRRLPHPTVV
jgi:hypothetical protein